MNQQRPNILLILTDDQGAWALGPGGNDEVITPNLDRMAQQGIVFDNFFCASPVCSPARASLLTGRIPSQHGVHDWLRKGNTRADDPGDGRCIEYLAGMPGYTDFLAAAGYRCGLSGKWHLGDSFHPQKGFSYWRTVPYGGSNYYNPPLIEGDEIVTGSAYLTDIITERALAFFDEVPAAKTPDGVPFYLGVHYTAPHSPWERGQHPEELVALYQDCPFHTCPEEPIHPWQINSAPRGTGEKRRELLSGYYASITAVDASLGRLLLRLEEIGAVDNTLVIFTSDNGMNMGHHGIWGKGNGTFPFNMYDSSVKVPFLIRLPGKTSGTRCEEMVSQYDFLPTLLDLLGIPNPLAGSLPGRSFAPILNGGSALRDMVVAFDEYGPVRMIRTPEWKYVRRYPYGPDELYDMVNDPGERENRIDDLAQQRRIEELRGEMEAWFVRYADPAIDGAREPATGKGQIDKAGVWGGGRQAYAQDWQYMTAEGDLLGKDFPPRR